jgi:hypothetical protein
MKRPHAPQPKKSSGKSGRKNGIFWINSVLTLMVQVRG